MCLVDALNEMGARRITVANSYYRPDWSAGINGFLEQAGFEILWSGNMVDQGLYASMDDVLENERQTCWDFPARDVVQACRLAHEAAPEADAVVQTGAGFRTRPVIETIEGITDTPLISSDMALYWAMLRELGLRPAPGHGRLMATLGDNG
jgi:maleate cis-trans isomerase